MRRVRKSSDDGGGRGELSSNSGEPVADGLLPRPGGTQLVESAPVNGPARDGSVNYHIVALGRALRLLQEITDARSPTGLTELESRTGKPKSTLVRLLMFLVDARFVVRLDDIRAFWVGPAIMLLAVADSAALNVSFQACPALSALATVAGTVVYSDSAYLRGNVEGRHPSGIARTMDEAVAASERIAREAGSVLPALEPTLMSGFPGGHLP